MYHFFELNGTKVRLLTKKQNDSFQNYKAPEDKQRLSLGKQKAYDLQSIIFLFISYIPCYVS